MSWLEQAKKKLTSGIKEVEGQKEGAMKAAVKDALLSFCEQNEEFAQAVAQGGSFANCMTAVAKGVGGSISDMEAYRKAVSFYFPGAEVRCTMSIDLIGTADGGRATRAGETSSIVLSLADFL